jgi:hypothetical protein
MGKVKENLEIILNIKDIQKRIKDLESKAPIPGQIGIATQANAVGSNTSSGTGNSGNGGVGNGGGSSGNADGSTVKDASDAFDNMKIGDRLDQLKGMYDCDTGDEITLSPNGKDTIPEGWAGANSPPLRPGWELGYYWLGNGTFFAATSKTTPYEFESSNIGYHSVTFGYNTTATRNTQYTYNTSGQIIGAVQQVFVDWSGTSHPENTGWIDTSYLLNKTACGGSIGLTTFCPTTAPTIPYPLGQPTHLTFKDGRLQTNPNQTDANTKYNNQSSLDFCFDDDTTGEQRHGHFGPANDGGTIMYETDVFGAPLGSGSPGMHFNADGVLNYTFNTSDLSKYEA